MESWEFHAEGDRVAVETVSRRARSPSENMKKATSSELPRLSDFGEKMRY
jgi:hypothetical protein